MSGRIYRHLDFSGELEVVSSVSKALFTAKLNELRARDDLIVAFRSALHMGMDINELSAETGFSPEDITRMAGWNLTFGEDLPTLTGIPR